MVIHSLNNFTNSRNELLCRCFSNIINITKKRYQGCKAPPKKNLIITYIVSFVIKTRLIKVDITVVLKVIVD